MNPEEARRNARECLRQALDANSTAETVKWLHEAEHWIRRGRESESRQDRSTIR
jgi:hypothetical protein